MMGRGKLGAGGLFHTAPHEHIIEHSLHCHGVAANLTGGEESALATPVAALVRYPIGVVVAEE